MSRLRDIFRWRSLAVLVAVVMAGAATWLGLRYAPHPSPDEVRAVIERRAPAACVKELQVRRISDIGGPGGLPDGMVRFYAIECDLPGEPDGEDPRLAVVYRFTSSGAASRWIDGFDAKHDNSYAWWLNGSTLLANIDLPDTAWRHVLADLARDHDGRRVSHRRR